MGAIASQLAVSRDSGSRTVTILIVRFAPMYAVCCSGIPVTALRRVSADLKMVTQCAVLEEFGIFLILANKVKRLLCSVAGVVSDWIPLHRCSLRTISRHSCLLPKERTHLTVLRSSMARQMFNSSASGAWRAEHS